MFNIFKKKSPKLKSPKCGDEITFRNGMTGTVIMYPSGNLGINISGYITLCEPLSNYNGLTHKSTSKFDIIDIK